MTDDKKKSMASQVPSDDEQPEIYGITKGKNGIVLNRRSFLGALAAAGALAACPPAMAASKPAASPKTPGSGKAHEARVDGLVLRDTSLSSWDAKTFKTWDIAKGKLNASLSKAQLAEMAKKAGDASLDLFQRIWDSQVLAFGPDGKSMAILGKDGVNLWQAVEGKPEKTRTLKEATSHVSALAFHPDGTALAASVQDGSITVWDLDDDKARHIKGAKSAMRSLAFTPKEPVLLSAHADGKVRQWNLPEGKAGKILKCHDKSISHLAVTPDGALAVTAADDRTIKLWSLPDGKQKASMTVPLGETTSAMALGPDGRILATGTPQGRIYLWRLPEGKMIGCLYDPALLDKGTPMAQHRQMGAQILTQPCDQPLPKGATCVCDCVSDNRICSTTRQVCTCDTIAVPAGYTGGGKEVCTCNTISVGAKAAPAAPKKPSGGCSCVSNVSRGGSHYWRPN